MIKVEGIPPEVLSEPGLFIDSLQKGYRLAEQKVKTGRRAVLFLCQDNSGTYSVVKLYKSGLSPSIELIRTIKNQSAPILIRVIDYGNYNNKFNYEVLQYVSGGTLADLVKKKGAISEEEIKSKFLPQLHQGLVSLKRMRIVHGDLKPGNIFIKAGNSKKLLIGDYGSALLLPAGKNKVALTDKGNQCLRGTPGYMAPEMFSCRYDLDKSDYYSLGFTLLFLFLGKNPYKGLPFEKIRRAHCEEELFLPHAMSAEFKVLVNGLLSKEATARWGAVELGQWLAAGGGANKKQSDTTKPVFFRSGNRVVKDENELALLLKNNPELARQVLNSGSLFEAVKKHNPRLADELKRIYKQALNKHLAYLEVIYTLDPALPYDFMPGYEVTTLDALASAIDRNVQSREEGIKQLKNGSILTWLKATGRENIVKEWERITKSMNWA